jgi:hypothetical protein
VHSLKVPLDFTGAKMIYDIKKLGGVRTLDAGYVVKDSTISVRTLLGGGTIDIQLNVDIYGGAILKITKIKLPMCFSFDNYYQCSCKSGK